MSSVFRLMSLVAENVLDAIILGPAFPVRHAAALLGRDFSVRLSGNASFLIRRHSSDASTIRQVFRNREYSLERFPQWPDIVHAYNHILSNGGTPVIIDAGANIGAASVWFSRLFPQAIILAIEPDPANAELCRRNTAVHDNICVIEKAIGATPGRVSLVNEAEEAWAVQTNRAEDNGRGVPVCTIRELLSAVPRSALFIAKIDIEGFEADLFASNTDWTKEAKVIIIEPHDWMPSGRRTSQNFQTTLSIIGAELLISGENLVFVRSD